MRVFVINLPQSEDRRVFQQQQLERLNLPYQVLDAVSVHDISEDQYGKEAFGWQRPLKKVELACFLSHVKAWNMVWNSNEPALIIEDDAVLVEDIATLLHDIERQFLSLDPELINLEVRSRKKILSKRPLFKLNNGYQLLSLFQERTGTGGYILFPAGARKLLDKAQSHPAATADAFIFSTYQLKAFQVEPAALIQEDQLEAYGLGGNKGFVSTIGRSEHFKPEYRSTADKIGFKSRRMIGQFKMAYRYLSVILKATKRYVALDKAKFKIK